LVGAVLWLFLGLWFYAMWTEDKPRRRRASVSDEDYRSWTEHQMESLRVGCSLGHVWEPRVVEYEHPIATGPPRFVPYEFGYGEGRMVTPQTKVADRSIVCCLCGRRAPRHRLASESRGDFVLDGWLRGVHGRPPSFHPSPQVGDLDGEPNPLCPEAELPPPPAKMPAKIQNKRTL